jgi:YHS domain-containing protein
MTEKHECIVCGRIFPEGQGVKLVIKGNDYYFHSKACAYKFLKEVIYAADQDRISDIFKQVKKKYEELLEKKREKAKKII